MSGKACGVWGSSTMYPRNYNVSRGFRFYASDVGRQRIIVFP